MVKNNLKSLLIHSIISFSSIFFSLFFMATAKWASEEAAIRHHNHMMFVSITLVVVALILYYLTGLIFLIDQRNLLQNMLSTILVGGVYMQARNGNNEKLLF